MASENGEQDSESLSTALNAADLNSVPRLEYAALVAQDGRRPIRLAALMPGRNSDEIECNLLYCDLEAGIEYEALSYRWGDATDRATIICDHSRLVISKNLETALRQLRHESENRILWIDGVCINQGDVDEREQQVSIMKDIYSRATRTVVWLGEPAEDDKTAFQVCDKLVSSIGTRMKPDKKNAGRTPLQLPGNTRDGFQGVKRGDLTPLLRLLGRPWFKRMWVIQETAVANHVLVMRGGEKMDLDRLYIGIAIMAATIRRGLQKVARSMHALLLQYELKEKRNEKLTDLSKLLIYTRRFEATDPRDKVYALYGLTSTDLSHLGLRADYHMAVSDVFKLVARTLLQKANGLELLEVPRSTKRDMQTLPSWAPDWSDSSTFAVPIVESAFDDYLGNLDSRVERLLQTLRSTDVASVLHPDPTFPASMSQYLSEEQRGRIGEIVVKQSVDVELDVEETMRIFKEQGPPEASISPQFTASRGTTAEINLAGDVLCLSGQIVDSITQVSRVQTMPNVADEKPAETQITALRGQKSESIRQLAQGLLNRTSEIVDTQLAWDEMALSPSPESPYPTGETHLRAYWQTLYAGHVDPAEIEQNEADFLNQRKFLRNARAVQALGIMTRPGIRNVNVSMIPGYEGPVRSNKKGDKQPSKFVQEKSLLRRLARTEKGYLGLVPPETEVGDLIVLLKGGRLPFVMKQHGHQTWELIGPSYVHGIMHGEAYDESHCQEIRIV